MNMQMNPDMMAIFFLAGLLQNNSIYCEERDFENEAVPVQWLENVSIQPWPTFYCLLDLRDRENK